MSDVRFTIASLRNAVPGASDDAAYRLDRNNQITTKERGFFGRIAQIFTKTDEKATEKLAEGVLEDLRERYGDAIGLEAFRMARQEHLSLDRTKPITPGQVKEAEVFAQALKAGNKRTEATDGAMRYAPETPGFAGKIAQLAHVDAGKLSAAQKQHYKLLLKERVANTPDWMSFKKEQRHALAASVLTQVAGMSTQEIRESRALLTSQRKVGLHFADSLRVPDANPNGLVGDLMDLHKLATARKAAAGPGAQEKRYIELAAASAAQALTPREARDRFERAMKEGGAGRALLYASAANVELRRLGSSMGGGRMLTEAMKGTGQDSYAFRTAAQQLHDTNLTMLKALAERGGVTDAEARLRSIEDEGRHAGNRIHQGNDEKGFSRDETRLSRLGGSGSANQMLRSLSGATALLGAPEPPPRADARGKADAKGKARADAASEATSSAAATRSPLHGQIMKGVRDFMMSSAFEQALGRLQLVRPGDTESASAVPQLRGMLTAELDQLIQKGISDGSIKAPLGPKEIGQLLERAVDARTDDALDMIEDAKALNSAMTRLAISAEAKDSTRMEGAVNGLGPIVGSELRHLKARVERDLPALERELAAVTKEIADLDQQSMGSRTKERERRPKLVDWQKDLRNQVAQLQEAKKNRFGGGQEVILLNVEAWAKSVPRAQSQKIWSELQVLDKPLSAIHAALPNLANALAGGAGIFTGQDVFKDLDTMQESLDKPSAENNVAQELQDRPLPKGETVSDAFWQDVSRNNYLIPGQKAGDPPVLLYDSSKVPDGTELEAKRGAVEKFCAFVGDPEFAQNLSSQLHQGLGALLTDQIMGGLTNIRYDNEPGILGTGKRKDGTEGQQLFLFLKKNSDGSMHVDVKFDLVISRFTPKARVMEWRPLDSEKSHVHASCSLDISKDGKVTLVRQPPPSYSFVLADAGKLLNT